MEYILMGVIGLILGYHIGKVSEFEQFLLNLREMINDHIKRDYNPLIENEYDYEAIGRKVVELVNIAENRDKNI